MGARRATGFNRTVASASCSAKVGSSPPQPLVEDGATAAPEPASIRLFGAGAGAGGGGGGGAAGEEEGREGTYLNCASSGNVKVHEHRPPHLLLRLGPWPRWLLPALPFYQLLKLSRARPAAPLLLTLPAALPTCYPLARHLLPEPHLPGSLRGSTHADPAAGAPTRCPLEAAPMF